MKKWLEALRYQQFNPTTFGYFLETFRTLASRNLTAETMRSLSLYVTYAIYGLEHQLVDAAKMKGLTLGIQTPSRRRTITASSPGDATPTDMGDGGLTKLSRIQVASGVLEVYTNMLCQERDKILIDRFARTITNKVSTLRTKFFGHANTPLVAPTSPF